jgi:hypothetical protein
MRAWQNPNRIVWIAFGWLHAKRGTLPFVMRYQAQQ